MSDRWTAAEVPDQTGRTAVVTGANTGIGYEAAKVLAERGATVVLAVRDVTKGQAAADRILAASPQVQVRVQRLDLTSLASVREAADALSTTYPTIDLLVNNAGVMWTPRRLTADGFELQLGTNHLGHFALTGLLLDKLVATPSSRVVVISSQAHRSGRIHFDDLHLEHGYSPHRGYAQSKLANLMFMYELQRRLAAGKAATIAVAAHPGLASTELVRYSSSPVRLLNQVFSPLFNQSAAMGALPTLRAATDPEVRGGQYYGPSGIGEARGYPKLVDSNRDSHDVSLQRRLWTVSEELTKITYPV
ncbi:MAG TPA: SDR family NAD(P)-dependent oxidoreductase [Micromonosporaceae bacterium]